MNEHYNIKGDRNLKRGTTETIKEIVYEDRARVEIIKQPHVIKYSVRKRYTYIVKAYFIFQERIEQTTFKCGSLKSALKYAKDIFKARNEYMIRKDVRFNEV